MERKEIGVIGYGSMGKMLVYGFLRHGIPASQIVVANRHLDKMQPLTEAYSEITTTIENEVAANSKHLFLCVEPLQMAGVLQQIAGCFRSDTHLITIAGAGDMAGYTPVFAGGISRVIPTLLAEIDRGYSLISHNEKVTAADQNWLGEILGKMGKTVVVPEEQLKTWMQFTSCGPAFIAALFEQWLAVGEQVLPAAQKQILFDALLETVAGTVAFMQQSQLSFAEIVARVATKGGITERGVQILSNGLAPVFTELLTECNNRNDGAGKKVADSIGNIMA